MAREPRRPDTPFWVEPSAVRGSRLLLDEQESHHLLKVHRSGPGAPFEAVDGEGTLYRCVIDAVDRHQVIGRIEGRERDAGELRASIHLLVGMPDVAAAESVVARAVPLGATAIAFVRSSRAEPWRESEARSGRLARLARAALKQCRRTRMPRIVFAPSLQIALEEMPAGPRFLADSGGTTWSESLRSGVSEGETLAVGPPGGFDPEEVDLLRAEDFTCISLGPNRLTTEDAVGALLALARQKFLPPTPSRH